MSVFDIEALSNFYARISAPTGMHLADFQAVLRDLFSRSRLPDDLTSYRLSKRPWKKLADEVTPVSRFLHFHRLESGRIRFPLDNEPPDCWIYESGRDDRGIEVTIAQATERYHLAKEMVATGIGRGFIGVSDDAPKSDFDRAMSRQRVMYSTDQARNAIKAGIRRCLSRKNRPKFAGFDLLIQAPLRSLPKERWEVTIDDLKSFAAQVPFREVHVIGNGGEDPWGFQIK